MGLFDRLRRKTSGKAPNADVTMIQSAPRDMALPGLGLHPLKGDRKGTWAVSVSGNWRVTFKFVGKDADSVDYEDYH